MLNYDGERVKNIYTGLLAQEVKCLTCQKPSIREEHFGDLNIPVDGFSSLTDSLNNFTAPETLQGDNKYHCENCNKLVDARKQLRLRRCESKR